jgi:hypothetical protein
MNNFVSSDWQRTGRAMRQLDVFAIFKLTPKLDILKYIKLV